MRIARELALVFAVTAHASAATVAFRPLRRVCSRPLHRLLVTAGAPVLSFHVPVSFGCAACSWGAAAWAPALTGCWRLVVVRVPYGLPSTNPLPLPPSLAAPSPWSSCCPQRAPIL